MTNPNNVISLYPNYITSNNKQTKDTININYEHNSV